MSSKARFKAAVIEGHRGVLAVIVPFDPEAVWKQKPVSLAGRRFGWLVKGSVNGAPFQGYVGSRWGNFFVTLSGDEVKPGDEVELVLEPTRSLEVFAIAKEQSKATTQPSKPREDAVDLEADEPVRAKANRRRPPVSTRRRKA